MRDIAQAPADIERFCDTFIKGLQGAVTKATDIALDGIHVNHRWSNQTGATAASFNGSVTDTENGAVGVITVGKNALRLADGTPAHRIYPRVGRGSTATLQVGQKRKGQFGAVAGVLVFTIGGRRIFAKYVQHPGTAPDPYLDQGADQGNAALDQLVEAALDHALGF